MATVRDIIERTYTKVNGEFEPLSATSDDFKTYLNVLNQVLEVWAHTPYVKWQSLYNMNYTLPTPVVQDQLLYPVVDADKIVTANSPYDSVYFVSPTGELLGTFKMTDQAMYEASNAKDICCLVSDGLHLKSTPEKFIGATIRLPAYVLPKVYATDSETVRVDSVPWLIASMAAFICSSSPVPFIARNADRYEKEAAVLMKDMKANNRHRQHLVIKSMADATQHTWSDVLGAMTLKDL